jgi:uncharacterized protein YbaR (Trm112 family)
MKRKYQPKDLDNFHKTLLKKQKVEFLKKGKDPSKRVDWTKNIYNFIKRSIIESIDFYGSSGDILCFDLTSKNKKIILNEILCCPLWNKYIEYLKEKYPDQSFSATDTKEIMNDYTQEIAKTMNKIFNYFKKQHPKWNFENEDEKYEDECKEEYKIKIPLLRMCDNGISWQFFWK